MARIVRTQLERRSATRRLILDAAIDALFEKGYGGTTTVEVQQRSGVSRGGLLHHYPSRTHLILDALAHLYEERLAAILKKTRVDSPDADRLSYAIRELWDLYRGRMWAVSLELWLAARHDEELRSSLVSQDRVMNQAMRAMATELFGPELSQHPRFAPTLEILLNVMRGAAIKLPSRTDSSEARLAEERVVLEWIEAFSLLLADPAKEPTLPMAGVPKAGATKGHRARKVQYVRATDGSAKERSDPDAAAAG